MRIRLASCEENISVPEKILLSVVGSVAPIYIFHRKVQQFSPGNRFPDENLKCLKTLNVLGFPEWGYNR